MKVIDKAIEACKNSNINTCEHFADVSKMIQIANNAERVVGDFKLTRYACKTHHNVGQAVRQTIKRIGGTMPEDMPTPRKSAKEIEKEKMKRLIEKNNKKKGK